MKDKYLFKDEKDLYSIIGKNIRYYRKLYSINNDEMTQEKLAEIINVSTSLIGNLESKKTYQGISIYNLYKRVKNSQKDLDGHTKKILALLYQYKKDNTRFKKILKFIVKKLFVNLAKIISIVSIAESVATGNYIGAMNSATNMLMNITGDYLSTDLTRNLYKWYNKIYK